MSDMPGAKTLVSLTQTTSARYGHIAAADGVGGPITFNELWQRSVRLAQELIESGIQPEDRVGLWAIQCSELLVGIVGILAAGAAYVPLDPSYPVSRLEFIATNSGLTTIVAPDDLCDEASQLGLTVISTKSRNEDFDTDLVLPTVAPHHAAYVIYTSGSTGLPKGVVVEHHSLVDLLEWMMKDCDLTPGDKMMGTAPPAFDASVLPLLLPLVAGVTFVALAKETTRDPYQLRDAIETYQPRALTTLPTVLRMFMEIGWSGNADLMIWTGGERMAPSIIRYIKPRVHTLNNYYGPTETTVFVTRAHIELEDVESPIGTPRDHVECVLLDADGQRTPQEDSGELFILGPCLARGYLNDAQLTAERFVTIDVDSGERRRAYRTGDIAKFRPDGSLLILGRADNQVKLRGFRIELGEIEQRLMAHPHVIDVAVVAFQPDELVEPRLVAFVKVQGDATEPPLRDFAKEYLPEHMVPSSFIQLEEFPLVPNGKIDQLRLNELAAASEGQLDIGFLDRPATELEHSVLELFASVLALNEDNFGVNEDFFDLGGTSLGCVRLFMSIEKSYGAALPLTTIVTAPTVRLLAAAITRATPGQPETFMNESLVDEWQWVLGILWSEILSIKNVAPTDDFFELGGSASDGQRMLKQLKAINGTSATLEELRKAPTIERFAALTVGRSTQSVLVPLNTHGSKTPFFCVAGPGGLALAFLTFSRELGADQPFYGLQARGLERRGLPDFTLGQAAKRDIRAIRSIQPKGPYLIGGHSLGGAVALKIAHGLAAQGESVALLAVLDSVLPSRLTGVIEPSLGDSEGPSPRWWHRFKLPAKMSRLIRLPLVGIIRQRGVKQFDMFGLHGSLQVYYGKQIPKWSGPTAVYAAEANQVADVEAGWGGLLSGSWSFASVPGDHSGMLQRPNVTVLAKSLNQEMAAALARFESPAPMPLDVPHGKRTIILENN
jgi:amino acid adenylation domain-containing protein